MNALNFHDRRRFTSCARSVLATAALFLATTGCGNESVQPRFNNLPSDTSTRQDTSTGIDAFGSVDAGPGDQDAIADPDTADPPDPCVQTSAADAAAFAQNFLTAVCQKMLSCTDNPNVAASVSLNGWTSVQACKETLRAESFSAAQAQQAAAAGTATLNSCNSQSCLDSIDTASCQGIDRVISGTNAGPLSACGDAWVGGRTTGAPCTVDIQCEGDQVCQRDVDSGSCAGACGDAPGRCGGVTCRFDQYCSPQNTVCNDRVGLGNACDQDYECPTNARCDGGSCTAIAAQLTSGQACNFSTRLCAFDQGCIGGSCSDFLTAGQPCEAGIGCAAGLFCNAQKVCESLHGAGDSCQADAQCQSGRCASGSCTSLSSLCSAG